MLHYNIINVILKGVLLWTNWWLELDVFTPGGSALALQDDSINGTDEMEEDVKVLMKADPNKQESLQSEVVPDPMEGEQTWPTEEELQEAEGK